MLGIWSILLPRLYQCSTHVSQPHSQTRDTHTYTLTISQLDCTTSQKAGRILRSGLSRPHSPVPQTMYWSQNESSKCSLDCLFQPRHLVAYHIYHQQLETARLAWSKLWAKFESSLRLCAVAVPDSGLAKPQSCMNAASGCRL